MSGTIADDRLKGDTLTLLDLLKLMKKYLKTIVIIPVVFTVVAAAVCWIVLPNQYTATTSLYVLTTSSTSSESSDGISYSDLNASQMITNDIATLVVSSRVLSDSATALGMQSLDDYNVNVDSSTSTRVITLSVTGTSQEYVAAVANQLAFTTDEVAREVMDVESVNVIDEATTPTAPSGPPRVFYTAISLLVGLAFAIALVVVLDMVNTRVRTEEEAAELVGLPVIGRIPAIRR